MKYIVFFLIAFTLFSCNDNKKKKTEKKVEINSAISEVSQSVNISKSDSIAQTLEKGETVTMAIIPTKTITVHNGKSFNSLLDPVTINGIMIGRTTREELLEKMGIPDSISKEPNYVCDDGGLEERFWYGKSNFRTFDGSVRTVDISDPELIVNGFLRVGMPEQIIQQLFPISFNSGRKANEVWRYEGKGYDVEYAVFTGDDLLSIVTKDGKIARMVYIYSI